MNVGFLSLGKAPSVVIFLGACFCGAGAFIVFEGLILGAIFGFKGVATADIIPAGPGPATLEKRRFFGSLGNMNGLGVLDISDLIGRGLLPLDYL